MKKFFSLLVILLASVFAILLVSCSKEKSIMPQPPAKALSVDNSSMRIGNWGSVTGMILPLKTNVTIQIFNDKFSVKDFYYTKDGSFRLDRIPPGIYAIRITYPKATEYPTTEFSATETAEYMMKDVEVEAGMLINVLAFDSH